jgi:hypothetical protein
MPMDLRPLTLGELLDRSFSLFRRHFWLFVGIMALPSVFALALGLISSLINTPGGSPAAITQGGSPEARIWFAVGLVGMAFLMFIVYMLTYAVALGATTIAVSHIYADVPTSIRSAYAPLKGKVGRLALLFLLVAIRLFAVFVAGVGVIAAAAGVSALATPILSVLITFVGIVTVFCLCLWVMMRYAVSVPVALLEDESATDAIRRSIELTRGNLGRVFALIVFSAVIAYAVLLIFQGPFLAAAVMAGPQTSAGFWANMLGTVSGSIGGAFTSPLLIVAYVVLYYDLRVRKEGLDLQLMLAGLDRSDPGAGTGGTFASPQQPA